MKMTVKHATKLFSVLDRFAANRGAITRRDVINWCAMVNEFNTLEEDDNLVGNRYSLDKYEMPEVFGALIVPAKVSLSDETDEANFLDTDYYREDDKSVKSGELVDHLKPAKDYDKEESRQIEFVGLEVDKDAVIRPSKIMSPSDFNELTTAMFVQMNKDKLTAPKVKDVSDLRENKTIADVAARSLNEKRTKVHFDGKEQWPIALTTEFYKDRKYLEDAQESVLEWMKQTVHSLRIKAS